MNRSHFP
jgi:cell fate (sporulation/competence/biofilm development) regulator YmcA (YheA/YmcA/DUF963 family)